MAANIKISETSEISNQMDHFNNLEKQIQGKATSNGRKEIKTRAKVN